MRMEVLGEGAPARTLDLGECDIVGDRRHDLHPGDEMGEFGEVGEHHRGIGAGIVLLAQLGERRRDIAAHHRPEQIDGARPVGEPQHLPHVLGAHRAGQIHALPSA
jgi:hypothetical protein